LESRGFSFVYLCPLWLMKFQVLEPQRTPRQDARDQAEISAPRLV
jgi:hypothetical protein